MSIKLYPYQKRLIRSKAKFILDEKSRQIGISFALGYIAIRDALTKKMTTIFQSMDGPKGINFIDDCKIILKELNPERVDGKPNPAYIEYEALTKEIRFENGGKIFAISSNPNASRAYNGNVFIDEAAFHDDFATTLTAALSCTDRGDGRCIVVSTHNGPATDFYALCEEVRQGKPYWEHHYTDLTLAIKDGYHRQIVRDSKNHDMRPLLDEPNFDELFYQYMKETCPSPSTFDQEYLCKVSSAENQIIPRNVRQVRDKR